MASHGTPRLEGRDHELDLLVATFAACRSEHVGRTVVVHGEAGTGASHLVRHLHDELRRRGIAHQWWNGRCTRNAPLAYEPFAGLLRAVPGDATAWLADAAIAGGTEAAGVALLAGLGRRIRDAADDSPVVVVVDDVDGADASTARMLLGVAPLLDDVPVLLLLVGRSDDAGLAPLGLARIASAEVIVNPLDPDDVARVVRAVAPELADDSVAAIVDAAGGRPGLAVALATTGDTERNLTSLLTTLDPAAPVAVLVSSLADGWLGTEELGTALGVAPATWRDLDRRRIVVSSARPGGGPVPVSELWSSASHRALGARVQPTAATVATLLRGRAPAATVAAAWEVAGRAGDASYAWEQAADEAEAEFAIETAAVAMQRAIELGGDAVLVRLGQRAGGLLLAAGERAAADSLAERLLPRLARDDERAMVGTLLLRYRARSEAGLAGADVHLDRALTIDVAPCREHVDVLVVDALRRVLDDPGAAAAQAARAMAEAAALDDLSALGAATGAAGLAAAIAGDLDAALKHFDSALAAAAEAGDAAAEARLASNRVYVLWRAGRPTDVEQSAAQELDRLRVRGLSALGDQLAVGRCAALFTLARLDDLDRAITESRAMKMAADAAALLDAVDADLAIARGDLQRAGELVERIRVSPAIAVPEVAADLWVMAASLDLARGDRRGAATKALAGLGECGEADSISLLRLIVTWWRSGGVLGDAVPDQLPQPDVVGAESRALFATIEAHRTRAPDAWAAAVTAWRQVPAPLQVLQCQLVAATDARDLNELDRIADEARALGAYGLSAQTDAAWRAAGGRRAPQRTAGVLTERELEVLASVAEGLTNREIGERLFISVRTVGAHLERCMAKLAVNTRGAAVHEARRQGLLTS